METWSTGRLKLVSPLVVSLIVLSIVSLGLTQSIDFVVNRDLYNSGLQFSYGWYEKYVTNLHLLLISLGVTAALAVISIISFLSYVRTGKPYAKYLSVFLLLSSTGVNILAGYLFNEIDYIVNNDLYSYGLTYSSTWAINYTTDSTLLLLAIRAAGTIAVGSSIFLALSKQKIKVGSPKLSSAKLTSSVLTLTGLLTLVLSIIYNSSTTAFVGLGLIFWGILFAYIRSERYTKKTLLDTTVLSQMATLNHIIYQLEFEGDAVYLPPRFSDENEAQKVFIAEQKETLLPTSEQTKNAKSLLIENPSGVLLVPPGAEIAAMFERTLKTSFNSNQLQDLQRKISKILVADFEIAHSVEMKVEPNKIQIRLKNSAYEALKTKNGLKSNAYSTLGSPLSSAIACVLTKATNRPVIIEEEKNLEKGKILIVDYRLL